jgi:hypothetical protein
VTVRTRVVLDRFNADLAYADFASNTPTDAERDSALQRAASMGAIWVEFYSAVGARLGRAARTASAPAGPHRASAHAADQEAPSSQQTTLWDMASKC